MTNTFAHFAALIGLTGMSGPATAQDTPAAPEAVIQALVLPPTAPSPDAGACSAEVNPNRTGCMSGDPGAVEAGSFLPGGKHVLARIRFVGAPDAGPGSAWRGDQLVVIAAGAPAFSGGDAWKCLTCGISEGLAAAWGVRLDRPQVFADGKRLLSGTMVFDCAPFDLADERCTPETLKALPVEWPDAERASAGWHMPRGVRLHPDGQHIGFNIANEGIGVVAQSAYVARLRQDAEAGRYVVENMVRLHRPGIANRTVRPAADKGRLAIDTSAIDIIELSGFSADGREAVYIGFPWESGNLDMFAVDLASGKVRRLTRGPGYPGAADFSPDGRRIALTDTGGSDRTMYLAAMRRVPPLVDAITAPALLPLSRSGARSAYGLMVIDAGGERSENAAQVIGGNLTAPGAAGDPAWSASGVPQWSPDSSAIVYAQTLLSAPDCGSGKAPACPVSAEPGGRRTRLLLARLSGEAGAPLPVAAFPDSIGWATPYAPGDPAPMIDRLPDGRYVLPGEKGRARIAVANGGTAISVLYKNYSATGAAMLNGTDGASTQQPSPTAIQVRWNSNVAQAGAGIARRLTGSGGVNVTVNTAANTAASTGSMVTTADGRTYAMPSARQ